MPDDIQKDCNVKVEINNVKTRSNDQKNGTTQILLKEQESTLKARDRTPLNNNSIKPKVNDGEPNEVLLGSTFLPNNTAENGHTLRASARVIHKLRMDSARPNSPPINLGEKKEEEVKKKEDHKANPKTPSQSKAPARVNWNNAEKNMFFEGLNEYGRDFDAIATFINNKQKRKNLNDPFYRTKDQVRVLYYQFYQKVSKYLKFSDEVKKAAQELYALINYGEMRKKLIFINEKSFLKLRELVYKGCVTIRIKGKNIKIKTPSCRALRKLNQLEEWQEEIKLPQRIDVILRPANVDAWGRVQSIAQNPRIKTQVPLQRRISTLLHTLQTRWRSQELRLQEKVMSLQQAPTQAVSKSKAARAYTFDNELKRPTTEPLICFAPPPEITIHRPVVHLSEFLSSDSICLNSYEQRIGVNIRGETLFSNMKRQRQDSNSEKLVLPQGKSPEQKKQKLEIDVKPLDAVEEEDKKEMTDEKPNNDLLLSPNSSSRDSNDQNQVLPIVDANIDLFDFRSNDSSDFPKNNWGDLYEQTAQMSENEIKTDDSNDAKPGMSHISNGIKVEEKVLNPLESTNGDSDKKYDVGKLKKVKKGKKDVRKDATHYRPLVSQKVLQQIREGWTVKNAGDLTFGDLYVMFGQETKLYLEYSWVQPNPIVVEQENSEETAEVNPKPEIQYENVRVAAQENISSKLKQLLAIAQLNDKTKRRNSGCTCGHICDHRKPKTDQILSPQNGDMIFKHPTPPNRRNTGFLSADTMRARMIKSYRNRIRPVFPGKQVIVQRILPVKPGMNHSYGVVTTDGTKTTSNISNDSAEKHKPSTPDSNDSLLPPECTFTVETTDGEISQLLSAKMNQISEAKSSSTGELYNSDSFKSLMDLSLHAISNPSSQRLSDDDDYVYPSTPLMSPMRILRESPIDDYAVEDVSLTSILGHLENARRSEDGESDTNIRDDISVMGESSIDYITRFKDMTAELENE